MFRQFAVAAIAIRITTPANAVPYEDCYQWKKLELNISACTRIIKLGNQIHKKNRVDVYFSRGSAYSRMGRYDLAIDDFNKSIELNVKYSKAYIERGIAFTKKYQIEKAIADFNEAIRLNPKDEHAFFSRGNAYREEGQYDKAIADYSEAIKINPKEKRSYILRGFVYQQRRQYTLAMSDYRSALKIDPNLEIIRKALKQLESQN